jgi:Arc/MetJ family transcription regulator
MADFLIETTNERGVVTQERVSVNETDLRLFNRSLVRIDGLERATTLRYLNVHQSTHFWCRISRILVDSRSVQHQLLRRRASVCARVDTTPLSRRASRSPPFVSSLSLLTPLQVPVEPPVVPSRCHWPHDGVDRTQGETDTAFALAVSLAPFSSSLTIASFACQER